MTLQNAKSATECKAMAVQPIWLWLSIVATLLAATGSVIALTVDAIYAPLTPIFYPEALAQDVANLALITPAILVLIPRALNGSLRAYLLWLGLVTFTVYNYAIYTFSIPFGALYLLWIAVFGLSIYALIGGIAVVDHAAVKAHFTSRPAVATVAVVIMLVALFFGWLWLTEDVTALLNGQRPQTAINMGLPTNPIHILDLAFYLPAVLVTGVLLLLRKPLAYTVAPALTLFLLLTGIPILIIPVIQMLRGTPAEWGPVIPIGTLTLALLGLLIWLLSTLSSPHHPSPQ